MDLYKAMLEEEHREYLEDVDIAISELTNMKLYPVEGNIICDLYAIPSHNFQSYYAIVYEQNGKYEMLYAKPQIYDIKLHEYIKMYRFKDAKEAKDHPGTDGKIVLGIKHLSDDFASTIIDLVQNFPTIREKEKTGISLDGYYQVIRLYMENNVAAEVAFDDIEVFAFPSGKTYLSKVLDDLYITVGEIIE